jgi:hypothetical protein
MLTKIVDILKTSSFPNSTYFGSGEQMEEIYTVVKQEKDGLDRGTIYRISGHCLSGQHEWLEDYIKGEVRSLLNNIVMADRKGNMCQLIYIEDNDYPEVNVMEIVFLSPHPK